MAVEDVFCIVPALRSSAALVQPGTSDCTAWDQPRPSTATVAASTCEAGWRAMLPMLAVTVSRDHASCTGTIGGPGRPAAHMILVCVHACLDDDVEDPHGGVQMRMCFIRGGVRVFIYRMNNDDVSYCRRE